VKRYNGPGNGADEALALEVSPDGSGVFVTGRSTGSGQITGSSNYDYATAAYDASTGAELWVKRYNGPGNSTDIANALRVGPDGSKLFVTGQSVGSTGEDYATVAYDASTGATVWVKRYTRPGLDYANSLGASPDGSMVFVTGQSGYDYATVAYDASTGVTLWSRRFTRPGTDFANALGVSPDGSEVFVTGASEGSTSGLDYATVAYAAHP
jgi:WD40 repeat protein